MMEKDFRLSGFSYTIPEELIAQEPHKERDKARLLVINRENRSFKEVSFRDLVNFLNKGDVLVLNNTEVIKARLLGKRKSGAHLEILLLKNIKEGVWETLVKPGKRARINDIIIFEADNLYAQVIDRTEQGTKLLKFHPPNIIPLLAKYGKTPLPPYIKKEHDLGTYQTVYAQKKGAVAAPTAGLHFTFQLIEEIKKRGVEIIYITLHCGLATFRPVKTEDIREHKMESEKFEISVTSARIINKAKRERRKIIAVGTTVARALESSLVLKDDEYEVIPQKNETNLYIVPGYRFKIIDSLITNFHTPQSTNLILVTTFLGEELTKRAYNYAIEKKFRFYSFGDAMFII